MTTLSSVVNNQEIKTFEVLQNNETPNINLNEIATKTFASLALVLSNTCLSVTVFLAKMTGITIIPTLLIGHATKYGHQGNMALSKHAFSPLRVWAEALNRENERMIETEKVIKIVNGQVLLNPENYKKQSMPLIKAVFAPISLGLSLAAIPLCIAAKPLWIAFFIPGIVVDGILCGYTIANNEISRLTYKPLQQLASWIHKIQMEVFNECFKAFERHPGF